MVAEMFDLTVIGAGIVGVTAAYLASQKKSDWHIALIDRSLVGSGTTQYSVGLAVPYGRTDTHKHLSIESAKVYHELKSKMPELPIHKLPLFAVVKKESLAEVIVGFTENGVRLANELEEAQLRRSYADLSISDDQVMLTGCFSSYGFAKLVTSTLAERFKERGYTECWEGVEIRTVHISRRGFALLTYDGRTIWTRRVLVAIGPWLMHGPGEVVAKSAGVRIKKVVALHVNRCPEPHDPVLFFFDEDAFLLPVYKRREWLFSFTSQEWDCNPDISHLRITAEDRDVALRILSRYCPSFVNYCHGGRVFCDAYTSDRRPIISQVSEIPDYVVAGACSGSGYCLAPGIAAEALRHFTGFPH